MRRCATFGSISPSAFEPYASCLCRCSADLPPAPLLRPCMVIAGLQSVPCGPYPPLRGSSGGTRRWRFEWHPRPTVSHTYRRPFPGSSPVLILTECAARPPWVDQEDSPLAFATHGAASPRPHLSYAAAGNRFPMSGFRSPSRSGFRYGNSVSGTARSPLAYAFEPNT